MREHITNFALIVLLNIFFFFIIREGVIWPTGHSWYETCSYFKTEFDAGHAPPPVTTDQYMAAALKRCETVSKAGVSQSKVMLSAALYDDPEITAMTDVCPADFKVVPWMGSYYLTLQLIDARGGLDLRQDFMRPEDMISEVYRRRWPHCADALKQYEARH